MLGVLTFVLGIMGSLMAFRRRNQALVIFLVIMPMAMNLVAVKDAVDMYALANPWLIILASIFISIMSGYFICNSDENFQTSHSEPKNQT